MLQALNCFISSGFNLSLLDQETVVMAPNDTKVAPEEVSK